MNIRVRRIYDAPQAGDGLRILVDRLWPRGVTRQRAALDRWMKDLAPSAGLRRWYGHDPARWPEFRERYFAELRGRPELVTVLRELAEKQDLVLLYACREARCNSAQALKDYIQLKEGAEEAP